MTGFSAAEADRRIGNMVQLGTVVSIDNGAQRVRVRVGDLELPPVPVAQLASGPVRFHWMPGVGEQVVVYAPSGDMARAFVQGSVPRSDGAVAPGADQPTIDLGGGTMRIVGKLYVDGDIEVTGDVRASGVSLVHHLHQGVVAGGANSGEPV